MSFQMDVIELVRTVPRGKVATYGQIAAAAGSPRAAIAVGQILHRTAENIPWQRIINSRGFISTTCLEHPPQLQAAELRREGVHVEETTNGFKIDLERFLAKI